MERFSISILHQQIYNICRLCGVDNPDKRPILEDDDEVILVDEEESTMAKKIEECVGILVHKNDQMPQYICCLCMDKVNDFYEYRLMCAATNLQTRNILHLPLVDPSTTLIKTEKPIKIEEPQSKTGQKRTTRQSGAKSVADTSRACKEECEVPVNERHEQASTEKRLKVEIACDFCKKVYETSEQLDRHLIVKHAPSIHKFGCTACTETFVTAKDLKNHHLWHKLSRTQYRCFRCSKKFARHVTLTKHIESNGCGRPCGKVDDLLVPDMRCQLCNKVFKTRNLFHWHSCFLRARASCPKCGKFFVKKSALVRHYVVYCKGKLLIAEPIPVLDSVKKEDALPNGLREPNAGEGKRPRGRPPLRDNVPKREENQHCEEEDIELPFPPPLELTLTVKTESSVEPVNPGDSPAAQRTASLTKTETENAEQTSVNTAIASIATIKKRRQVSYRTRAENGQVEANVSQEPMVVFSMSNIKQEQLTATVEESERLRSDDSLGDREKESERGNDSVPAANVSELSQDETNDSIDGHGDGFGDFCDEDDHSDANENQQRQEQGNDEAIPAPESSTEGTYRVLFPRNYHEDSTQFEQRQSLVQELLQIKQEPTTFDDREDVPRVSQPMTSVCIKQEPLDGTHDSDRRPSNQTKPIVQQPLRMKIKKEKGLFNATVLDETVSIGDATPTLPRNHISLSKTGAVEHKKKKAKRSQHGKVKSREVASKKHREEPVRIKQEILDPEEDHAMEREQCQELHRNPIAAVGIVNVKQEPVDTEWSSRPIKSEFPTYDPYHAAECPAEQIAPFDGIRIKMEQLVSDVREAEFSEEPFSRFSDVEFASEIESGSSRLTIGASNTQGRKATKIKTSKMINPFALMRQKVTMQQVAGDCDDASPNANNAGHKDGSVASSIGTEAVETVLPIISQVTSIERVDFTVEHLTTDELENVERNESSLEEENVRDKTGQDVVCARDDDEVRQNDVSPLNRDDQKKGAGSSSLPIISHVTSMNPAEHVTITAPTIEACKEMEESSTQLGNLIPKSHSDTHHQIDRTKADEESTNDKERDSNENNPSANENHNTSSIALDRQATIEDSLIRAAVVSDNKIQERVDSEVMGKESAEKVQLPAATPECQEKEHKVTDGLPSSTACDASLPNIAEQAKEGQSTFKSLTDTEGELCLARETLKDVESAVAVSLSKKEKLLCSKEQSPPEHPPTVSNNI
ncbi:uncharacterized protein LOC131215498 [Anopheles bellator]|uniref:uncharacterized protein LOC131215498 n=1 Tax=Anopheles bellator TaxID=139047 RepID=UPI0026478FEB|nr:uncharacterized protein LOC131215498 [Anopheles bellator]